MDNEDVNNAIAVVLDFETLGATFERTRQDEWRKAWKEAEVELFSNRREDAVEAVREVVIKTIDGGGLFGTFGIIEDFPDCSIDDMTAVVDDVTRFLVEKIASRLAKAGKLDGATLEELRHLVL